MGKPRAAGTGEARTPVGRTCRMAPSDFLHHTTARQAVPGLRCYTALRRHHHNSAANAPPINITTVAGSGTTTLAE